MAICVSNITWDSSVPISAKLPTEIYLPDYCDVGIEVEEYENFFNNMDSYKPVIKKYLDDNYEYKVADFSVSVVYNSSCHFPTDPVLMYLMTKDISTFYAGAVR